VQESLQTIVRTARGIHEKVGGGQESADAGEVLKQLEEEMWEASEKLEYERAALLRDQIEDWKRTHQLGGAESPAKQGGSVSVRYSAPKKVSAKNRPNRSK
jgi:excinuclease ABC subunit B